MLLVLFNMEHIPTASYTFTISSYYHHIYFVKIALGLEGFTVWHYNICNINSNDIQY